MHLKIHSDLHNHLNKLSTLQYYQARHLQSPSQEFFRGSEIDRLATQLKVHCDRPFQPAILGTYIGRYFLRDSVYKVGRLIEISWFNKILCMFIS